MVLLTVLVLAMALPLGHYLNLTLLTVLLKILITPNSSCPYYLVGVFIKLLKLYNVKNILKKIYLIVFCNSRVVWGVSVVLSFLLVRLILGGPIYSDSPLWCYLLLLIFTVIFMKLIYELNEIIYTKIFNGDEFDLY